MTPRAVCALLLAVVFAGPVCGEPRESPLAEGRRALTVQGQRYGTLPDEHAVAAKVRDVFGRIVRAAGQRPGLALEVHVLDTPRIIVEALRGGLVVVSRGFVEFARGDENALAWALGHEVAHLVRDHHAILDSLGVLGATLTPGAGDVASAQVARAYQAMELDADRLGALFAALAGYRAAAAAPTVVALAERAGPDLFHPAPGERAVAIRTKLAEIADHLELFQLGVFFTATGRYLDGARVLEHFLSMFPSREVLAAVGVAYHKEALRYAREPEFRHLLVVDATTRALGFRGVEHPVFKRFLDRAVQYYTQAVTADPAYAPALANLAAAHLDLGDRDLALGWVNRALRADPTLASAYNNRALAVLQAGDARRAEEDFLTAARLGPGLRNVALNLSRLYEKAGRAEDARRWAARSQPASPAREAAPDTLAGVVPGASRDSVAEWLGEPDGRRIAIPLGGAARELTLHVLSRRGIVLVVRDNAVEAVATAAEGRVATAQGLRPGDPAAKVDAAYGRPAAQNGLQGLSIWEYPGRGLAVFMAGDRVQAIWMGRRR